MPKTPLALEQDDTFGRPTNPNWRFGFSSTQINPEWFIVKIWQPILFVVWDVSMTDAIYLYKAITRVSLSFNLQKAGAELICVSDCASPGKISASAN